MAVQSLGSGDLIGRIPSPLTDPDRLQSSFGDADDLAAGHLKLDDESDRLAALDEYAALPDGARSRGLRMAYAASWPTRSLPMTHPKPRRPSNACMRAGWTTTP